MERWRPRLILVAGLSAALLLARPAGPAQAQAAPACAAAALSATAGWQGAGGALAGSMQVTNAGDAACALSGVPGVQVLDASGNPLAIEQTAWPNDAATGTVLSPGDQASAPFAWRNWCAAAPAGPFALQLALAGGGETLTVPVTDPSGAPRSDTPRCDDGSAPSTIAVGGFGASGSGATAGPVATAAASLPDTGSGPRRAPSNRGQALLAVLAMLAALGATGIAAVPARNRCRLNGVSRN